MKIQFLNGGLANQVFQYIFARYYELSHPGEFMYLDDSYFALHTVHNGYELEKVFGLKPHMLSECFDYEVWNYILQNKKEGKSIPQILCENGIEIYMISEVGDKYAEFNPFEGKVIVVNTNQYEPYILGATENVYYHGYWINKNWFMTYRDIFLKELQFPAITETHNLTYMEQIRNTNSVSIHIRRGDYVMIGQALDVETYRKFVNMFMDKMNMIDWHLFVFSDDIGWCRQNAEKMNFQRFANITYIEGNERGNNYRDLQLMSKCKAMIISNSAFCFLAALLNTEKKCLLNLTSRDI